LLGRLLDSIEQIGRAFEALQIFRLDDYSCDTVILIDPLPAVNVLRVGGVFHHKPGVCRQCESGLDDLMVAVVINQHWLIVKKWNTVFIKHPSELNFLP